MLIKYRIFILLSVLFLSAAHVAFAQNSSVLGGIEEVMKEAAQFNKRMEALIEKYKNADPGKDAKEAFNKNDLRFISITGNAPGTGDAYPNVEQYGVFFMPDTGDVILSQKHEEYQRIAYDYAKRYNEMMLSLVKEGDGQPLTLTIKSDKRVYQAGENIILSVILENKSAKEMIVYWNNDIPSLRIEEKGAVVAYMSTRGKDFEILHIKPREAARKDIFVKSDALLGEVMLMFQYDPTVFKMGHKLSMHQEIFKEKLVSNRVVLRVDKRISDILDVECTRALSIGAEYIIASNLPAGDYKLIKAENMVTSGSYMGPHIWHLTYKAKDLIERGKGGEIFLEVDMNTQQAKLLGYGE